MKRNFAIWLLITLVMSLSATACSGRDATLNPEIPAETHSQPQETVTQVPLETDELLQTQEPTMPSSTRLVAAEILDPLGKLLSLRSVKISLSGTDPDTGARSITIEIDAAGNMHVVYLLAAIDPTDLIEGLTLLEGNRSYEVYCIADQAYGQYDSTWTAYTGKGDFITELTRQMHALSGFTLWLDMLPSGSLRPDSSEATGGFSADQYEVNGSIDGELITGGLWYDQLTHALVRAELHVPSALDDDPQNPAGGEIVILLNAEQTTIPPISLPAE